MHVGDVPQADVGELRQKLEESDRALTQLREGAQKQ
jgi:hypothetical protein